MFSSFNIKDSQLHAHSRDNVPDELFYRHCDLTAKYSEKIFKTYQADQIIQKLLEEVDSTSTEQNIDISKVTQYIKDIIIFHDLGKLTKDFQNKLKGKDNKYKYTHSDKSYFLITYQLCLFQSHGEINTKEFLLLWSIAYAVHKHHSNLGDYFNDIENIPSKLSDKKKYLEEIFKEIDIEINNDIFKSILNEKFWHAFNRYPAKDLINSLINNELVFFILIKLIYSILISADYFATMEYQTEKEFEFNVFDKNVTGIINKKFHTDKTITDNFNPAINEKVKIYRKKKLSLFKKSEGDGKKNQINLNELRSYLNIKAEDSLSEIIKTNKNGGAYFLNVPTGGGKTNLSMRLALHIMKEKNINKLFYVFPFINLIEQSYNSLKSYIGEANMTRLDSKYIDANINEEIVTSYKENLFFNYPVLFLSHVKFFDLFFRNDKKSNYNFYQLCNSVVIIDEIQAYNDELWTTLANVFGKIAKLLNIHFIVMSATLPEINRLIDTDNSSIEFLFTKEFTKELFQNDLFKRCNIIPDNKLILEEGMENKLAKDILKKASQKKKVLIVVNTVKASYKIYSAIVKLQKEKGSDFGKYKILLLNSTILDFRRKEIIELSKQKDEEIILVATQSVEAGVDIDFDIGFRAYSPLDSIIQVEGRVNRNNSKDICDLYVFKDESFKNIYKDDYKAKATRNIENDFFKEKDKFNSYAGMAEFYSKMINEISKDDTTGFLSSSADHVKDMKQLRFQSVDKNINLIEGDSLSLFIPVNVDSKNYPKITRAYPEFITNGKIRADKVWERYKILNENKFNFEDIIILKDFRKILIPFIINIFDRYTSKGKLSHILSESMHYGFYFCDNYQKYYEIETGLNVDEFKKIVSGREVLFI